MWASGLRKEMGDGSKLAGMERSIQFACHLGEPSLSRFGREREAKPAIMTAESPLQRLGEDEIFGSGE
jgi:hypothetical protein